MATNGGVFHMKVNITRLRTRADLLKLEQADALRDLVLKYEDQAPAAVRELLAVVDRYTAAFQGWTFVMLSPEQNHAVVAWIQDNAQRPRVSARLWAAMFCHLRVDTQEIVMDRTAMMAAARASSAHVSQVLSELAGIGALIRRREGHDVRWFMNPHVGTCLTGKARQDAQQAAPRLCLIAPQQAPSAA